MDYKIFWSDESLRNLGDILTYLETEWTEKEINKFKEKLGKQIDLIAQNPTLFPESQFHPNLRKAVLSKHNTVFYEIKKYEIHIAYLFSNRMDIGKLK